MSVTKFAIPHTDTTVEVAAASLPANVIDRLFEMAVTSYLRSAVSSALANEKTRAEKAHDEAEAAAKKADAKYKPVKFDADAFESEIDLETFVAEKIAEMESGTIRAARGKSGENKALIALVTSNVVGALKAKGKAHKEATAMVAGDPFAFIEKSARKRAGDDDAAYQGEIKKLYALYVDPAKAILGGKVEESDDADDLI